MMMMESAERQLPSEQTRTNSLSETTIPA